MANKKWTQRLVFFLVAALAFTLLAACQADDEDGVNGEGGEPVSEEIIREQAGEPGDTDLGVEPDEGADVTLDERELLEDDGDMNSDSALQEDAEGRDVTAPTLLTAADFVTLNFVNESGEETGEMIEALFDAQGVLRYVILDSEAIVQVSGEEVGAWAVPWEDLDLQAAQAGERDIRGPFVLTTGTAEPDAAPVLDTVPLAVDELSVDTSELGLEGAEESLLRMRAFVGLDTADLELVNDGGDSLGAIANLLVAAGEGRVAYLVADTDNADNVLIPWQALEPRDSTIVYTLDEQLPADAPTVEDVQLNAAITDQAFVDEVDGYWQESGGLDE